MGALVDPVFAYKPQLKKAVSKRPTPAEFAIDVPETNHRTQHTLTEQQITANYLLQFLNAMVKIDSKLTGKQILRNDPLFAFLQKIGLEVSHLHSKLRIQNQLALGFGNWVNVYEI